MPIDARTHLASLVGRPFRVFSGATMTVIELREDVAVVRTLHDLPPRRRFKRILAPEAGSDLKARMLDVAKAKSIPAGEGEQVYVDEPIRIEWVQWGIDRLFRFGEVPARPDTFGLRSEVVFMLLLKVPGAQLTSDPPKIVLKDRRAWNLRPGEAVLRADLHERFGGNSRTRISPSAATRNVFIVLEPGREESALWNADVLHVLGERIRGSTLSNANRAILGHQEAGRALRVFWRTGADLVYAGEFELDAGQPFYFIRTQGSGGALDRRIVFRLLSVGKFVYALGRASEGDLKVSIVTLEDLEEPHPVVAPTDQGADRSARHLPGSASFAEVLAVSSHRARLLLARVRHLRTRVALLVPPVRLLLARGLNCLGARGPWPPVLLCSCAASALTTWGWTSSPLRPAITTWFLLVCPGMALVRLLPSRGALARLVLAVATSLTVETLVAEATLEAKAWSPSATLGLLIVLIVAASAVDLWAAASGTVPAARPRAALRGLRGG